MNPQICKQMISFLLVFAMLSTLSVTAHASELENDPAEQTAQVANTTEPTDAAEVSAATGIDIVQTATQAHQARFDAILTKWLRTTQITEEELQKAVTEIADYREALWEVYEAENAIVADIEAGTLTEAQVMTLLDENPVFYSFTQFLQERHESDDSVQFYKEVSVLDGKITVTDTSSNISESNNVVTVKANGGYFSQTTNTITIANASANTAKISFDYAASNYKSFSETTSSGSKNIDLAAGDSITMSITGKKAWSSNTATLTLSNFSYTEAAASSTVTFDYSGGSVTANGEAVSNGGTKDISSTDGATLVATPSSGYKFLGWVNGNTNVLMSNEASYLFKPTANMTVRAAFASAGSKAWFKAGDHLVDDLNKAVTLSSVVMPMYDGTLPAGNYTIPAGVTLLIPYDAAGTLCTTRPPYHENAYTAPTVFRTLTMANGANITVNGAISVASAVSSKQAYAGSPSGPYGHIKMESGSKITVASNATLYAWGYITGSGSVEVKSSGKVYECVQVTSFRGGDVTSQMTSEADTYGVFPFNQYYVQNVEVPMTLHSGATETGLAYIYVTLAGVQTMELPFIGNVDGSSMFVINSGYVVKDYLEGTGRTKIQVYGDLSVTEISVSMKTSLLGSVTIDTSKYALPIPHHFTISLESGNITMNQSMAFLPGSELYIGEGTTCTLGSKKKIYVYDLDQWLYNDGANGYSGITNLPYMQLKYVPGGDSTASRLKDALIQIDGTVDATAGSVYVTAGGANIYSTGTGVAKVTPGTDKKTYQIIQNNTDISSWPEIPILPAILQDADSTDVSTGTAGDYTYYASTGRWCTPTHRYSDGEVIAPTCTDEGYTKYTCIACGHFYTEAPVDALGHTPAAAVIENRVNATCEEGGSYEEVIYCSVCGEELSREEKTVAALGHDEKTQVVAATCTTEGYTLVTCSRCDYREQRNKVAALGHTEVVDKAIDATCTESGKTEGKHCSVCGEVLIQQNAIAALGHDITSHDAQLPTLDAEGHNAYETCSRCGHSTYEAVKAALVGETEYAVLRDALAAAGDGGSVTLLSDISGDVPVSQNLTILTGGHSITVTTASDYYAAPEQNNTIKVWKLFGFYGTNIAVQDSLDINFFLDGSNLKTDGNYTAKITRIKYAKVAEKQYTKPETLTEELTKDQWTARGQYFVITYDGIAAKEMPDVVTIQIYEDGHPVSIACQESVVSYTRRTLDKNPNNSELRTVLVDMLNYGSAAQTHFGYQTATLANAVLTAEELAEGTKDTSVAYHDNHQYHAVFAADSVTIESDLTYTFYFDFSKQTGAYAIVNYTTAYGKEFKDVRIDAFRENGNYSGLDIAGLAIGDGYQLITCQIYDSSDTLIASCAGSIESYIAHTIKTNTNPDPIYKSMMKFIQSAYGYFH